MDVGCFGWALHKTRGCKRQGFWFGKNCNDGIDTYDVGLCNPLLFVTINPLFIFIVMLKIITTTTRNVHFISVSIPPSKLDVCRLYN